jgi:hypothetical protein
MSFEIASTKSFSNLKNLLLKNQLNHVHTSEIYQLKDALFIWVFFICQILELVMLCEMLIDSIGNFLLNDLKIGHWMTQFKAKYSLSFISIGP